jgi:hypothetical protein
VGVDLGGVRVGRAFAYYAGKRRTLKAVASTAHCANEGYISDMEAYPELPSPLWSAMGCG